MTTVNASNPVEIWYFHDSNYKDWFMWDYNVKQN